MEEGSSGPGGSREGKGTAEAEAEGSIPGGWHSMYDHMSLLAGTGTFSCFHGDMEKRPTVDDAKLRAANGIKRRFIDGFYAEAARRLPLKEMPWLDGCICAGGLCFGLADPVTNIILNAVGLLLHDQQEQAEVPPAERAYRVRRGGEGWGDIAYRSLGGLRGFMTSYFRYLGATQAARYLYLASHNLPLAIALVRHDRFGINSELQLPLLPDGGNLKDALRIAAVQSKHPAPDLLAQLMTAEYPSELLWHVLAKLQGTEPLTAHDVSEIMGLLAHRWPPAAPPVNMEFWCRPNGTTCTRDSNGNLQISTCIEGNYIAKISIQKNSIDHQLTYISDLTFHCQDMEAKLSDCVQAAGNTSQSEMVKYDVLPCEHIVTLEMCLLNTIHAFYIKALAILPSSPRLLRALIVAGHCYGPMEPIYNIILNTIWYDMAFLPSEDANVELPQGILDTRPLFRLMSHSLDGLVEMARSICTSRHHALQFLNCFDCNLYESLLQRSVDIVEFGFHFVAEAAKHPRHAAHASFLRSLKMAGITHLRAMLTTGGTWSSFRDYIFKVMPVSAQEEAPCSLSPFASMQISRKKSIYKDKLTFVHCELTKVLRKYCNQHPWVCEFVYRPLLPCFASISICSNLGHALPFLFSLHFYLVNMHVLVCFLHFHLVVVHVLCAPGC